MVTRGSERAAKRRTAQQRVQERMAERMAAMAQAAEDVMVATEDKAAAEAAAEAAEDRQRAAVARLAELGETPESIAELTDLDVTLVRSLRRPKRDAAEDQPVERLRTMLTRREGTKAAAPVGDVTKAEVDAGDHQAREPHVPEAVSA